MSDFHDDLESDLGVFFDDFARPALLRPDSGQIPVRVIISAGIERYLGDRYIKNAFEIRVWSTSASQRDLINVQDADGNVTATYILGEPISRDRFTVLWGAERVSNG